MAEDLRVIVCVNVFDRRTRKLPCDMRYYRLDWDRADPDERTVLRQIFGSRVPTLPGETPLNTGDKAMGWKSGWTNREPLIGAIKHLLVPEEEYVRSLDDAGASISHCDPFYFEDEEGNELGKLDMLRAVSGNPEPLIVGMVESVVALGPALLADESDWGADAANTIADFLHAVDELRRSKWVYSPIQLREIQTADGKVVPNGEVFPNTDETRSAIVCVRQLYAGGKSGLDNLLRKTVEVYAKHCLDRRKVWWVNERRDFFERVLSSPPSFARTKGFTALQLIEAVVYGGGILHAPTPIQKPKFDRLCATNEFRDVCFDFHASIRSIFGVALEISFPVRQDLTHWTGALGKIGPDRKRF